MRSFETFYVIWGLWGHLRSLRSFYVINDDIWVHLRSMRSFEVIKDVIWGQCSQWGHLRSLEVIEVNHARTTNNTLNQIPFFCTLKFEVKICWPPRPLRMLEAIQLQGIKIHAWGHLMSFEANKVIWGHWGHLKPLRSFEATEVIWAQSGQ